MKRRYLILVAILAAMALLVTACGDDEEAGDAGGGGDDANTDVSGNLTVMAVWTGAEQAAFEEVLQGFMDQYPDVTVKYNSSGDQLPTVLGTAVEGGNPPDLAVLPQPGLMNDFAGRDALQPIEFVRGAMEENYAPDWITLGEVDGQLYGMVFKGANKSTVWYNVGVFEDAGVEPPATWDEFLSAADTINASGVPAYSIPAADGWTLTDLFENIYLRTAGPDKYDQLAKHEIPWTDQSVKDALTEMAKLFSNEQNVAGGISGALQTDFPTSVSNVFTDPPKAAMVIEGDFVQGVITDSTDAQPETDFNVFPFPAVNEGEENVVVGGGDMVVMFKDTPAAQELVKYLATPEAAEIWAARGGFSSPNQGVSEDVYPDPLTQQTATALAEAETFRFDMSDLAPAAFGGTPGQGEWKILQDFLRSPDDVNGTAQKLEQAAAKAFGD
jgi:ABC-type glycerol-3-phosphate transport system substrate-binding protein